MALCISMDKIGPMARSAEDCAAILQVIAGHDSRDPSSCTTPMNFRIADRKFRLGVLLQDYTHADSARNRFGEATDVFRNLGYSTDEMTMPSFPYATAAETIVNVEGAAAFEELIRSERLYELVDPDQQAGLLAGLAVPGVDYLRALRIRTLAAPEALKVFDEFDALIAPTLLQVATPIEKSLSETFHHMGGNGAAGNLLGWPSISIPMGGGENDLPLGLEIIGAPYDEATILSIAIAFQRATDHHKRRPKSN
jgi:aspartyl-tRNA(Asn)/glutamyl-tRNA(Gln) amidotransferase subunit A